MNIPAYLQNRIGHFISWLLILFIMVRRPSCYSCIRVNTLKSTSDAVTRKLMTLLDERRVSNRVACTDLTEQNAASEVDKGMKEEIPRDEDTLTERSKRPSIDKCHYSGLDYVLFVKGSGPHVIQYGDQSGKPMKEVIVSRKCAEAVLRGAQVHIL